jgi:hypothetical protein
MKLRRIIFILLAVLLLSVVVFCLLQPGEPSYQGRKLSDWLNDDCGPTATIGIKIMQTLPLERIQAARNAVCVMGTNAIPTLLKWAQARDSSLKTKLNTILDHQHFVNLRFKTAAAMQSKAIIGFLLLGTNGLPAVPALVRLARSPDPEQQVVALHCLISIPAEKKDLFPLLQILAGDQDNGVKWVAANYLKEYDDLVVGGSMIYRFFPQLTNSLRANPPVSTQ